MSTQADDYRHCVPVYYPGFSSLHPSPLPVQYNKPLSLSSAISAALASYEEVLTRYGIKNQLPKYLNNAKMKDFIKDAYWWMFLEHFVSVDFDALLQQVKGNTLVNDEDMKAFQFDTVVPVHLSVTSPNSPEDFEALGLSVELIPTLPIMKANASIGAPTRHRLRDTAKQLPAHLTLKQLNRHAGEIALIGSPRCISAQSIAETVESRPQSALRAHKPSVPDALSATVSMTYVEGADAEDAPAEHPFFGPSMSRQNFDDSDLSDSASDTSSVSSALRVTNFTNSRVLLHKLPLEVRLQIAAKEQHQLFTRMAMNYGSMTTQSLGMNVGLKDAITRMLPEILAQLIYYLFARSIPFAMRLLDIPFQVSLGQKLSFWIGGVERIYSVRQWGIHAYLDPIKRIRKNTQRNASIRHAGDDSGKVGRKSSSPAGPGKSVVGIRSGSPRDKDMTTNAGGSSPSDNDLAGRKLQKERVRSDAPSFALSFGRQRSDAPSLQSVPSQLHLNATTQPSSQSHAAPSAPNSSQNFLESSVVHTRNRSDAPPKSDSDTPSPRISDPPTHKGEAPTRRSDVPPPRRSDAPSHFQHVSGESTSPGRSGANSGGSNPPRSFRRPVGTKAPRPPPVAPSQQSSDQEAMQKKKELFLRHDLDTIKNEFGKFKSTHTFSQFHYSGQITRQVPTFRDADIEVNTQDTNKVDGVQERLPSRIANAFSIGPKKRNIQVIKADLDAKFLSNPPWYAGKHQRVPLRDTGSTTKFSTNNWSPLLHRFMLANGEENLRPADVMNWTM